MMGVRERGNGKECGAKPIISGRSGGKRAEPVETEQLGMASEEFGANGVTRWCVGECVGEDVGRGG